MPCRCGSNYTALIAELLAGLLVTILVTPLAAQPPSAPVLPKGPAPTYDVAHELAFDGNIQAVITQRQTGSPAGLHLIISGEMGTVDAHLGPFLTQETREALHMGLPVHVVGCMKEFDGRSILLARLISFGGRTVIVRSSHGALVLYPSHAPAVMPAPAESANGGSR